MSTIVEVEVATDKLPQVDVRPLSDLARSATEFYDLELRATLEITHLNEFIAIEPESRTYYFGKTLSEAIQAARRSQPDRYPFVMRVGHRAAIEIGHLES